MEKIIGFNFGASRNASGGGNFTGYFERGCAATVVSVPVSASRPIPFGARYCRRRASLQ